MNGFMLSITMVPDGTLSLAERLMDFFRFFFRLTWDNEFINDKRVLIDLHRANKEITFQKISDIQYRIFDHGKDLGLLDMNCPHPAIHRQRAEYSEDRIEKSRETRLQQYAEARLLDQDCTLDRIGRKKFGRHTYYFGAEFAHQKGQIRETTDEVIFSQHGTILKKVPKKGQFPL